MSCTIAYIGKCMRGCSRYIWKSRKSPGIPGSTRILSDEPARRWPMMRKLGPWLATAMLACVAGPAAAWSNHTLAAWPALAAMPELKAARAVRVESLEDLLAAEARGLVELLQREEAWARANIP